MINKKVLLEEIQYIQKEVDPVLLQSIEERGIAIPVKVRMNEEGYECLDGHQRCSACAILKEKDQKFSMIPIMITNDYSKAGSAYWGDTQNKH